MTSPLIGILGKVKWLDGVANLRVSTLSLSTPTLYWESGTLFIDYFDINLSDLAVFGDNSRISVNHVSPELSTLKLYNKTIFEYTTNNSAEVEFFRHGTLQLGVVNSEQYPKLIINGTVDITGMSLNLEILGEAQDSKLSVLEANQM